MVKLNEYECDTTLNSSMNIKQEAQLPIRNRASAMHFSVAKLLSIAVMTLTYSYIYTAETYVRQICYAHSK